LMVDWIRDFMNEASKIEKYRTVETMNHLTRRLGLNLSEVLKLDANENLFIPLDLQRSLLREAVEEVDPRRYPQDERIMLQDELGEYLNVEPEQILIGAGGDQLIELVFNSFLKRGDEVVSIAPTFSIYELAARIRGIRYRGVPLKDDFTLDLERLISYSARAQVIFLCSPNNPTANQFRLEEVKRIIEEFEGLVVVDEAYVEFASHSISHLADVYENLIVLRTFSKAFGLAGFRIGYAISNSELASILNESFQMPYPASQMAILLSLKILRRIDVVRKAIEEVKAERGSLIRRLNEVGGVKAFNSDTNFVLASFETESKKLYDALLSRGVLVKMVGNILNLENCLRITVAPPKMMDRFMDVLKEALK